MNDSPVSKVLVLDESPEHAPQIKQFCEENNLVPLRVRNGSVIPVLKTNIDLGGILCAEGYGGSPQKTHQIAAEIHAERPELPIFLRRQSGAGMDDLPESVRHVYCAAYSADDLRGLRRVVDEYIFCLMYPNALLRGIAEITRSVLSTQCSTLQISLDTPYIVRDRVIFGELFSLIQLESSWCRGYMMLQTEETSFLALLGHGGHSAPNFRDVNDLLSEVTNLIWGSFKNRYIGDGSRMNSQVQVPIIVNHKHKYISFGSENPQLCFRFTLSDPAKPGATATLYVRFAFNLSWSPHDFKEIPQEVAGLVESGALEMF
jgi:hypothetical protein